MNVLFVTYDFPFPITSGGKNRAYNLIKYTARDVNIYLYSFVREDFQTDFKEEILSLGVKEIVITKRRKLKNISSIIKTIINYSSIFRTLYFEKKVLEDLKKIIKEKNIDIIHFESSYTGFYLLSDISKMRVKTVLGTENIEFMLYAELASTKKMLRPIIAQQADRLKKEELDMVAKADAVTTITKTESDILMALTGKRSQIVANGIDPKRFGYDFKSKVRNNLLFVGNFTYFPNIDAMNFFLNEVFDKLNKKLTFTIIGKGVKEKFGGRDDRLVLKEFVDNIEDEYRDADILVFPVRIGGGTNFKILEAMALGTPIVAFPDRLSGFEAKDEEHFLSARDSDEFVSQINRLYESPKLREDLAKNSRKLVEETFAWEKIGKDLLRVWKNTL